MEPKRLKTFESVIKNFAAIDFNKEKPRFHIRQCLRALEGFSGVTMQALYLFYNANTNKEFIDSIYMTSGGILIWVVYVDTILKTEMIYISIDEIEKKVNASKFSIELSNIRWSYDIAQSLLFENQD